MLPHSPDSRFASASDHRACRAAIRGGSRSFYAASWLLPPAVARAAFGLYAFCRLSDDAVDLEDDAAQALARLEGRLADVYAGRPHDHPADRALADLVRAHHIPLDLARALIEGFAWDSEGRRYQDIHALHAYAARVAGAVGVMMTLLMGVRDPEALARAADLGVAMQLTNIARDVSEDARAGRLYLPLDWLDEAGVDAAAFLAAPAASAALARVVARLLAEAERLYRRAEDGVARLPATCRPAILAAASIYAEIGRELARRGYDPMAGRTRVGATRKLALLARSGVTAMTLARRAPAPPLAATAFLIEAVARHPTPEAHCADLSLPQRFARVLDMFERLERADQMGW